jgi:hypothetical protein
MGRKPAMETNKLMNRVTFYLETLWYLEALAKESYRVYKETDIHFYKEYQWTQHVQTMRTIAWVKNRLKQAKNNLKNNL